ncbi:1370_t:CDS:2 [Paraglomus occultum]|uniref:1370_t:CDS:1 n=1 Tax=Paraglomus occultum TaxID=144539 RepID=A0A9N8WJW0_9GLOM|nr:1370_t:CDS:2 [Paraglomus occultum]
MDVPSSNSSFTDLPNTSNIQEATTSKKAYGRRDKKDIEKIRLEKQRRREEQRILQQRQQQEQEKRTENGIEPILRPMVDVVEELTDIKGERVKIMTYNILAQSLCRRELFPQCGDALKWKNRRPGLLKEMLYYSPDIGCFQEMDENTYIDTFKPEFEKAGYDCVYVKSTKKRHGCCIIWRISKFTKLKEDSISYDQFEVPTMPTECVGLIVVLEFKSSNKATADGIVIGTTHLYWRPQSMYERSRQCLILVDRLNDINKEFEFHAFLAGGLLPNLKCLPWFVLGLYLNNIQYVDFNSAPEDPSYALLTGSSLTQDHIDILQNSMKPFCSNNEDSPTDSTSNTPHTELRSLSTIISAFKTLPKCVSLYAQHYTSIDPANTNRSEPKFTNYGEYYKGTLDYIFYLGKSSNNNRDDIERDTSEEMQVVKLLKMPREMDILPSIPNYKFNSDHLCLIAEVSIN